VSSALEERKKEEVSRDELLKQFEERANDPYLLHAYLLNDLGPHILKAILETNADAMKKAEAIESFGDLMGSFGALSEIYFWFVEVGLQSPYLEGDYFKKDVEEIVRITQEVAKEVIELYFEIKKVRTLDVIIYKFRFLASKLNSQIAEFAYHVLVYIAKLKGIEHPRIGLAFRLGP